MIVPEKYLTDLHKWIEEIVYESDEPDQPMYEHLLSNIEMGEIAEQDYIGLRDYSISTKEFAESIGEDFLMNLMNNLTEFFFPNKSTASFR